MTIASLKPGEKGRIRKIMVDGPMKRRLMDMGLLVNEEVEVERAAPFGGPIEVLVKGYSLSIRRKEAREILVDTVNGSGAMDENEESKGKAVTIAITGNPNSGKSTLINSIAGTRLQVGNWPGVTIDKKEALINYKDKAIKLVDLPGAYSLSPYTQEQLIARDYLINSKPDVVINVIDATNLERSLFFTIQLLELNLPVIIALNMFDEVEKKGYKIDIRTIEQALGVKVIPTVSTKKRGLNELMDAVLNIAENKTKKYLPKQLNYDEDIETAIKEVTAIVVDDFSNIIEDYPIRWLVVKLIEHDRYVLEETNIPLDSIYKSSAVKHLQKAHGDDLEGIMSDARYAKATGLVREVFEKPGLKKTEVTKQIDAIVLNKVLGLPIFFIAMWLMFKLTFDISTPFVDWIDGATAGPINRWSSEILTSLGVSQWLVSLITDGIIGGVGFVMVFVPVIVAMMFFITFLEGSGYMARAAFVMDRAMHSMGLHGNSFIPMILGFGCNVPAIYATRTLENPQDRILTSLLIPLMSCGARLPVYVLFTGLFFSDHAAMVLWSLYLIGIALAVVMGIFFRKTIFHGNSPMFILELPPYRIPTLSNLMIHTWEKAKHFIVRAGTYILAASIVVWFLFNLPWGVENKKDSLLGKAGQIIAPVFKPLGFGTWEASSSLITGIVAKEVVVGTMGEIYAKEASEQTAENTAFIEDLGFIALSFSEAAKDALSNVVSTFGISSFSTEADEQTTGIMPYVQRTFTPLSAYAFMVFVLLYMPCLVTAFAFKQEFGTWKWFGLAVVYEFTLAWGVAFIIYQGGTFLGIGP
ncbi:iron transporter FeoB [Candidatus Magnetoovum chiemensis]|nr:iron transporter FeoB [Candidatus Magnetoovum chiemensis]